MPIERTGTTTQPAGLLPSVTFLALIVGLAMVQLAWVGNWPKVIRVAAATMTYIGMLLPLCRSRSAPPLYLFVVAGRRRGR